jgi:hypothetical protein
MSIVQFTRFRVTAGREPAVLARGRSHCGPAGDPSLSFAEPGWSAWPTVNGSILRCGLGSPALRSSTTRRRRSPEPGSTARSKNCLVRNAGFWSRI